MNLRKRSVSQFQLFPVDGNGNVTNPTISDTESEVQDGVRLDFINILPIEINDYIFSYLNSKDLLSCCRVSTRWRHAANTDHQWKMRCKEFQPEHPLEDSYVHRFTKMKTHVDKIEIGLERRTSLAYLTPRFASSRIEGLCNWGRYFRQCFRLRRNWEQGYYVTHNLYHPQATNPNGDTPTTAASNFTILAIGTDVGNVYIHSLIGVPTLRDILYPPDPSDPSPVDQIRISNQFLTVLYDSCLIQVYKILEQYPDEKLSGLEILLSLWILGYRMATMPTQFTLFWQDVADDRINGNDDVLLETHYVAGDLICLMAGNSTLIVTGSACNCFLVFDLKAKDSTKKVQFPFGVEMCRVAIVGGNFVYFTTKMHRRNHRVDPLICVYAYELKEPYNFQEFQMQHLCQEICVDTKTPYKIAWVCQNSIIYGANVKDKKVLFSKTCDGYVDSFTIHHPYILYHNYDGIITALDWTGAVVYTILGPSGMANGFKCFKDYLLIGSARSLEIFSVTKGCKLQSVGNQPLRIQYLFIYDTKIVSIGLDNEPPVFTGFW